MLNRLTALFVSVAALIAVSVVLSPHAYAGGLNVLPSDSLAGGGSGDIYWFQNFGAQATSWPTTDKCLHATGGASSYRSCAAGDPPDSRVPMAYTGQIFIRYMTCGPVRDHTLWDGGSKSLTLSLFEVQGSDTEANFVRNQIGGTLNFTESDGVGVTKNLPINASTTIENGQLSVKFSAVSAAPSTQLGNGFVCTVAIIE